MCYLLPRLELAREAAMAERAPEQALVTVMLGPYRVKGLAPEQLAALKAEVLDQAQQAVERELARALAQPVLDPPVLPALARVTVLAQR